MSMSYTPLEGKKIILGVSGGIAAYKAVDFMRALQRFGADVHVALTKNARNFISPLTFSVLSGHPVCDTVFPGGNPPEIDHITMAENVDLFMVVPATANIIGKFANGIADDFLSTLYLSTKAPLLIAPAMNWKMYEHKAVQENISRLEERGAIIVEPDEGDLACREFGKGKLASVHYLVEKVIQACTENSFAGKQILVTAGPTREYWDAFRYLSNPSSGKMGYAIARAAWHRGAEVTLITGPTNVEPPCGIKIISVTSALDLLDAVKQTFPESDVLIMAAAVSDFRPANPVEGKMKKGDSPRAIELVENPDILKQIKKIKKGQIVVGFAAETENLVEYAKKKIDQKGLDCIVANHIGADDQGFQVDTNKAVLIFPDGQTTELPMMTKDAMAKILCTHINSLITQNLKI